MVDYVNRWTDRAELTTKRLLGWLGLGTSKFYQWRERYGKANEHNGQVPRDWWLEDWEKQAIFDFHDRHPREGYRRLTFIMLDDDDAQIAQKTEPGILEVSHIRSFAGNKSTNRERRGRLFFGRC